MNKFINSPDRWSSLGAVAFWLAAFAGGAAIFWVGLLRIVGALR